MRKHIFIFIFSIIIFCSIMPANAKQQDLIFAQVSDLHFFPTDEAINNYENLIKSINSDKQIRFVAFTGDNIDKPNDELLMAFLYFAHKIHVPVYFELGDHDCLKAVGLPKKTYLKYVNKLPGHSHKSFNYYVKKGDYLLVFVDGSKETMPSKNGYYNEITVNWLDKVLTKYDKKYVIIFQHYPLYDISPDNSLNLYKPDLYRSMIQKHDNIIAIIAGHYHINNEKMLGNIIQLTTEPAKEGVSSYRKIFIHKDDDTAPEIYSQVVKF